MAELLPSELDPKRYELHDDGLPREIVGSWTRDKHARLERYITISQAARSKYVGVGKGGATLIDLFSGPGVARIRDDGEVVPGSPLAMWQYAQTGKAPFTEVFVADYKRSLCEAASARLKSAGAPVTAFQGEALQTVKQIVQRLNPYGLHFAFLDPFNLDALPFEVIRHLATIERMDIIVHVSALDLQRNLQSYISNPGSSLDKFAPGWRDSVDVSRPADVVRAKILEHWRSLVSDTGMEVARAAELVSGTANQRLYWLAFIARHKLALEFWDKIRVIGPQQRLLL